MVYRVGPTYLSQFLQEVDIFRGLPERHFDRIAALCEERAFRIGDYLGVQNELGSSLYVIRSGEIILTIGSQDAYVVVRRAGARETLFLGTLFEPPLLLATGRASTDGEALVIPRVRLLELCELEPKIGMHIFRAACGVLVNRYRYALDRLMESANHSVDVNPSWKGAEV